MMSGHRHTEQQGARKDQNCGFHFHDVPPKRCRYLLASGPPASHSWYTCFAGLLFGYWPVPPTPLASGPPASHSWYTCFAGLLFGYWPVPPRLLRRAHRPAIVGTPASQAFFLAIGRSLHPFSVWPPGPLFLIPLLPRHPF